MASHIFITDLEHGKYTGDNQTSPDIAPDDREMSTADVKIGNKVWIGENVIILKGLQMKMTGSELKYKGDSFALVPN